MSVRTAILIASLAVNLFLGGFLISNMLAGVAPGTFSPGILRQAAEALPTQVQSEFLSGFATHRREFRRLRRAQLAAAWQVRNAFIAEPYDPARVEEAFAHLRDANAALQALIHDALAEQGDTLTADQRRDFLQAVVRGMAGHGRGAQGGGSPGGGPWR